MGLYQQTEKLEEAEGLDPVAETVQGAVKAVIRPGRLKDVLSGTWLGHPVHPLLVSAPIGAWLSATLLDLTGGHESEKAADRLVGAGVLAALPTAASGAADWSDTLAGERRIGLVHALGNYAAVALMGASWVARRRGRRSLGVGLSLTGDVVVGAAGYLGGHLAYNQGVGVDTTAFETGPEEWTAVASEVNVLEGEPSGVDVDGVRLVLIRRDAELFALAARCTHRGGPLDEGTLEDGCIVCPWHKSAFRIDDGSVVRGPAVTPQPAYEVRAVDGMIEVRRREPKGLRTAAV
ncbi:MAG: Rieske 2Fe-2S domain-containing protein [Acidimicrobiia bacterium]|nr:Rieske 2Fe-2S domain-containing protein [Acidimicrobiia bacterium]